MQRTAARVVAALVHAVVVAAPLALRPPRAAWPGALLVVALSVALSTSEASSRKSSDPARLGAPGTRSALASAVGLLLTTWAALVFPSSITPPFGMLAAAAAAGISGVALRVVAVRTLGDAFTSETVLVPGRPVVTRGLYAWLRHPSDVGLVVFAFALAAATASVPAAAIVAATVVPSTLIRIAREERLLAPSRAR